MTDIDKDQLFDIAERRACEQFDRQDWGEARRSYGLLTRLRPENPRYWAMLGTASTAAGEPASGIRSLQKALELQPDYPAARLHLAEALMLVGKLDEGLEIIASIFSAERDPEVSPEAQSPVVKRAGAVLAAVQFAAGEAASATVTESTA